ncbi:reductive dehalogenase [Prolixibacteraceae bacterium JC049]|nr:reductive dehalogenase [Prolixibacteraceae bacterium JC049]
MDIANLFFLIIGVVTVLLSIALLGVSLIEKEFFAAKRSIWLGIAGILLLVPAWWSWEGVSIMALAIAVVLAITAFYLFWPYSRKIKIDDWATQIDERDIMFSRARMAPDSDRFKEYYQRKPENYILDKKWRKLPGLMSSNSKLNHRLLYAAADAGFATVEALHPLVETNRKANTKANYSEKELTTFIKKWAQHLGALDCGITVIKENHWYSHIGRGDEYGNEVRKSHKYAIAFTVEMSKEMMDSAPKAPCVMESSLQYLKAGTIATHITEFIRNMGYDARAHIDGNYRLVCPTVAVDAGLGEIGRMGLLMTPKHGPRVRVAVVSTDMPLIANKAQRDTSVIDFCRICKKCADLCPAQAIETGDRKELDGSLRWQINSEKCFTYWCSSGTDCGRCMSVCPYSHPNNWLHNIVRWMIRYFPNFRKVALIFDDFIYGRKPKTKPFPNWIPSK